MKFTTKAELIKEVTNEHLVAGAIFESKHGYFTVIHEVTPKGQVIYSQSDELEVAKKGDYLMCGKGGLSSKEFLSFRNEDLGTSRHGLEWSVQITPLPVGTKVTLIKGSPYEGVDDNMNPAHGVVGVIINNEVNFDISDISDNQENPWHYHVQWDSIYENYYHLIGDLEVVGIDSEPEPEPEVEVEEPKPETPKARAIRLLEEEDTLEVSGRSTGGGSWVSRIVKARNKSGIDKRLVIKITEGHYQDKNLVLVSEAVQDLEIFTNSRLPITVVKA